MSEKKKVHFIHTCNPTHLQMAEGYVRAEGDRHEWRHYSNRGSSDGYYRYE
jgi:hypothetical protein